MIGNTRTIWVGAAGLIVGFVLAAPLSLVGASGASAQEAVGYLVPSMGTTEGSAEVGEALRGSLNAASNSVRGRAIAGRTIGGTVLPGGVRVAGIQVSGIPVPGGRSATNVAGTDIYGRPDKRFTGQRCEAIEGGVRVLRGC